MFGPDKFTQRMTLSEALRDDVLALKAGVFTLLPNRDSSGRHLLHVNPKCHCRESFESASMVSVYILLRERTPSDNQYGSRDVQFCIGSSFLVFS